MLVSSTTASFPPCNRCVHQSTAAYYYEDSPTSCKSFSFHYLILIILFGSLITKFTLATNEFIGFAWFDVDGGACGYGNLALEISKGYFAAAVPSLYKGGAGCGACYQVWIF